MPDQHPEYNRQEVKKWGRTILRLRKTGTFCQLIDAEIDHCQLTVSEIAEICNTTRDNVYKWRNGKSYPVVHNLWHLAHAIHGESNCLGAYLIYTKMIVAERSQNTI